MRLVLLSITLCSLGGMASAALAAPDVYGGYPAIGEQEGASLQKGIFLTTYTIPRDRAKHGAPIILPHPLKLEDRIRVVEPVKGNYHLTFAHEDRFPGGDIRRNPGHGPPYHLVDGDLFPYYGRVYRMNFAATEFTLTDVTDRVPEQLVPLETSRTITSWPHAVSVFLDGGTRPWMGKTTEQFEWIAVDEIDEESHRAKLSRTPATRKYTPNYKGGWFSNDTSQRPTSQWVKQGDILQIGPHKVRVEQIVLRKSIPNVGRPIGWVEFATVDGADGTTEEAMLP